MRNLLIVAILLFSSCDDWKYDSPIYDNKFCIEACIKSSFQMFHSQGKSWGTRSSSMQGLSQSKIFDNIKLYCEIFYKNKQCCPSNHGKAAHINHGYDYGECRNQTESINN